MFIFKRLDFSLHIKKIVEKFKRNTHMANYSPFRNKKMNDIQLDYLRLHESLAKTNSPDDQPEFDNITSLFKVLKDCVPSNGKMDQITVTQYENILSVVQNELNSSENVF